MGSDFRARRGLRALVVTAVMATSVALVAATGDHGRGRHRDQRQRRAQRGAQWLANQIKANGGFVESFGSPDPVNTAYAVIGMRAAGIDKPASDKAILYLKKQDRPGSPAPGHRLGRRARGVHHGVGGRRAGSPPLRRHRARRTTSSTGCSPPRARPGPTKGCSARRTRRSTARSGRASRSPRSRRCTCRRPTRA